MAALVHYDAARKALAVARTTDEVKNIRDKAEAMRAYAQQAKDKQLEIDAAEIRIRAERRLGELLKEQKETVGLATGGQPYQKKSTGTDEEPVGIPTLADAGIDKKLSARAQKMADIPVDQFEERLAERREQAIATVGDSFLDKPHVTHNSGENEWYTPVEFIHAAHEVLGDIDLDPCSSARANEVINASRYFTIDDDGLSCKWEGRVWMNPPYSSSFVEPFTRKLAEHYKAGDVTEAIVLVNNATETAWFQSLASKSAALCFPAGRIKYWGPNREINQPLQGQAMFYLGKQTSKFETIFRRFGVVLRVA